MKPFRERNPVIIGAIGILALALLLVGALRAKDLPLIGGGETYYATFAEAGGLKSGDEVRIAGVRVGSVDAVSLDPKQGAVRVAFRVETDSRFGKSTAASIRIKTLLGQMYLALEPEGDSQLPVEATIPLERTTSAFDTIDAFQGLAETADELDTDQLGRSLTTLADLTRNTPEEFRGALSGLSRLSSNLAARDGQINSLLGNLKRFSTVLSDRDQDIIKLMDSADTLFNAVVARRAEIHRVLLATTDLSQQLTRLIQDSRADLNPALERLNDVLVVLNKNEDNLDNSLRLLSPFYRVFANTLGTGPWFDTFIQNLTTFASPLNGISPAAGARSDNTSNGRNGG